MLLVEWAGTGGRETVTGAGRGRIQSGPLDAILPHLSYLSVFLSVADLSASPS